MSQQGSQTISLEWDLADRMRKALRLAGIGVQEIADALEVTRNTAGNYINGRTTPPPSTVRMWALRCGVPYEWLRDGTAPAAPTPDGTSGDRPGSPTYREAGKVLALRVGRTTQPARHVA